jgi:hypothetical protein
MCANSVPGCRAAQTAAKWPYQALGALPACSQAVNLAFFFEILIWVVAAGEML